MKFALITGIKSEATKGSSGFCPICGSELFAKCGELKINHWAHKGNRNCDPWWENETYWHRSWKGKFPIDWQEVIHFDNRGEKHIADVKTKNGWVIEFQHSYLKHEERRARNAFYGKLIWVVDGTRRKRDIEQFAKTLNKGTSLPSKSPVLRVCSDECSLLREWGDCHVPVFFDFGDGRVLWYLLYGFSEGSVYIAQIPSEYFIEVHSGDMTQKACNFDKFVKDISRLVTEYESYLRAHKYKNNRGLTSFHRR